MDKIKKYKEILKKELTYQASIKISNAPNLEHRLVVGNDETEFVIFLMGWENEIYRHGIIWHFGIENNKVYLYRNNTDIEIGEILVEKGIPKSDIVLEFVSKYERTIEGYALA